MLNTYLSSQTFSSRKASMLPRPGGGGRRDGDGHTGSVGASTDSRVESMKPGSLMHKEPYGSFRRPSTPSSLSSHGGSGGGSGGMFRPVFISRVHPSIPIEGGEREGEDEMEMYQGSIDMDEPGIGGVVSSMSGGGERERGYMGSRRHHTHLASKVPHETEVERQMRRYQKEILLLQMERDVLVQQVQVLRSMHGLSYQPSTGTCGSSISGHGGGRGVGGAALSMVGAGEGGDGMYSRSGYQGMDMSGTSATLVSSTGEGRRPSWTASGSGNSSGDHFFVASSKRKLRVCVTKGTNSSSSPTDTDGYGSETDAGGVGIEEGEDEEGGEEEGKEMILMSDDEDDEDGVEEEGSVSEYTMEDQEEEEEGSVPLMPSSTVIPGGYTSSLGLFQEERGKGHLDDRSSRFDEQGPNHGWDTEDEGEPGKDVEVSRSLGDTPKALVVPSPVIPADLWESIDAVRRDMIYEEEEGEGEDESGDDGKGEGERGWRSRGRGMRARYREMCQTLEETSKRIWAMSEVLGIQLRPREQREEATDSERTLPDASALVDRLAEEVMSLLETLQGVDSPSPPVRAWGREVLRGDVSARTMFE
ncbi:MAG: hypothetical protein DHS80DRAFT_25765 [Piptocephalis tieghemiana]|nr:MAG: hypothetical protein DHS80DRAFT_25765 [Piptocephalis tieghemiana]